MQVDLKKEQSEFVKEYQNWIDKYFKDQKSTLNPVIDLLNSMEYSLKLPGKRFRPFLAFLVWKVFKTDYKNSFAQIVSWCLAVEFIHTYSLIHDDLPCIDNDDFRRGKPSNHKVFGEDVALLAGDALLTEAFHLIANDENLTLEIKIRLIQILSEKIGVRGMVAGQVLDMKSKSGISKEELQNMHLFKTGYLIEAAALGGAIIGGASEHEQKLISDYAKALGLAFQIKDDLMDASEKLQDHKSYVSIHGIEKTRHLLNEISEQAVQSLKRKNDSFLIALVEQNISRET